MSETTQNNGHHQQSESKQNPLEEPTIPLAEDARQQLDSASQVRHAPYTRILDDSEIKTIEQDRARRGEPITTSEPLREGLMRLQIVESRESITIPIKENIVLGRPDPVSGIKPEVDLTPMAGYRMGVSRRHAEIHWYHDNTLRIYDLGSSNGTYLNGERLEVNNAYTLYNGDEIRLGQLAMYVYYEIQASETIIPIRDEHNI